MGNLNLLFTLIGRTGLPAAGAHAIPTKTGQRKIPPFGGTFLFSRGSPSN
jgi:hypothetical protein